MHASLGGRRHALIVLALVGLTAAACGGTAPVGSSTPTSATTVASTTTTPTTASTTTTTTTTAPPPITTTAPPEPSSPQPNASDAASALVSAWADGNRARALTVATAQSVATLFAARFPPGAAIARGCSDAFPPLICTFGPPGGGNPNDPIYQISVSQGPGGWYVSNVVIESGN